MSGLTIVSGSIGTRLRGLGQLGGKFVARQRSSSNVTGRSPQATLASGRSVP
jgi:hypothetical protein